MVSYCEHHRTVDYVIPVYGVRLFILKNLDFLLVNSVYLCNVYGLSSIESKN
jgi:hypothetical protein